MQYSKKFIILAIILIVGAIQNCGANNQGQPISSPLYVLSLTGPDYRLKGSGRLIEGKGSLKSSTGCEVNYTRFMPQSTASDIIVLLGHGFLRSERRMVDMARHLASWGIDTVTVDFCNSKLWAGNHGSNGEDMVAVSQQFQTSGTIYMGFSAGGLAALIASKIDPDAHAYFGLDMVDHRDLGEMTAPGLKISLFGLLASPSACNADRNGLDVYAKASRSVIFEVTDATHCHFEFPMDAKCTIFCGSGEKRFSREDVQHTILGLTTAFLLWQTGIDQTASSWWSVDSDNYRILTDTGLLTPIAGR